MPDQSDIELGRRLRRRRRLLGLTQGQLGAACGVRFQQIQKYESGANRLSAVMLWKLACALAVDANFFFGGWPAPSESLEPIRSPAREAEARDHARNFHG